jgi:hypothetical protein
MMKRICAVTKIPLALAAVAAASVAWTQPAFAAGELGGPLVKTGDIAVAFVGADAFYSNDVYYFLSIGDIGGATFLFNNHTSPVGTTVDPDDSALNLGDQAIFGICVDRSGVDPGPDCQNADDMFFTGGGENNPDNIAHTIVWNRADYEAQFGALDPTLFPPEYDYVVGFEDIHGGGDRDFNDAIFAIRGVTVLPEPITMTLLATGLAGIGGAGLVRTRMEATARRA